MWKTFGAQAFSTRTMELLNGAVSFTSIQPYVRRSVVCVQRYACIQIRRMFALPKRNPLRHNACGMRGNKAIHFRLILHWKKLFECINSSEFLLSKICQNMPLLRKISKSPGLVILHSKTNRAMYARKRSQYARREDLHRLLNCSVAGLFSLRWLYSVHSNGHWPWHDRSSSSLHLMNFFVTCSRQ